MFIGIPMISLVVSTTVALSVPVSLRSYWMCRSKKLNVNSGHNWNAFGDGTMVVAMQSFCSNKYSTRLFTRRASKIDNHANNKFQYRKEQLKKKTIIYLILVSPVFVRIQPIRPGNLRNFQLVPMWHDELSVLTISTNTSAKIFTQKLNASQRILE